MLSAFKSPLPSRQGDCKTLIVSPKELYNMNNRPNRDLGNPLAMPELARLLGAPIVLQANTMWMLISGALFLLTVCLAWWVDSPKDTHLYIVVWFSVPVGLLLGYRAKRLKLELELTGAQPLRTAIGVAWRIGALWVMVSAIGEYLAKNTTSSTMADFPGIFGLSLLAVGGSFLVAYGATAALIAVRNRSSGSLGWAQVLNLLIGISGLIIGMFGLPTNSGTGLQEKTGARMSIATLDSSPPVQDSCLSDQIVAGPKISCILSAADGELLDGTHYRPFRYSGAMGERITISMWAEDFDAYLILGIGDIGTSSFELLAENDDGGIGLGTNSRLNYTFAEDASYTVVANTLLVGETGHFRLQIDSEK